MKKILITGAGSFIGTSFEKYIQNHPKAAEYEISVMDTLTGKTVSEAAQEPRKSSLSAGDSKQSKSNVEEPDDTNQEESGEKAANSSVQAASGAEAVDYSEKEWDFTGYDVVFHVAGIAHADVGKVSEEGKELYKKVNTDLAIDVAKKAKAAGVKQFIFMSSAIVYGASSPIGKEKVINKDTKPEPENFYGESKLNAEKGLKELDINPFKVVILRPPMIYGPGCRGNYNSLRKFALKLPFFPKVKNERSMLYIDNLCEFIRLMIDNEESGTFHPANAELSNTSDMVRLIAKAHDKKIALIGGTSWLLKIMSHFTGLVNKAFGNLTYSNELTEYKENYRVCSLEDSILSTEKSK